MQHNIFLINIYSRGGRGVNKQQTLVKGNVRELRDRAGSAVCASVSERRFHLRRFFFNEIVRGRDGLYNNRDSRNT